MFSLVLGFSLGVLTIVSLEIVVILLIFNRFKSRKEHGVLKFNNDLDADQSVSVSCHKKGIIWLLESKKIPNVKEATTKEQNLKREIVEVFPVKTNAEIKDHVLILTYLDGTKLTVNLMDYLVQTVSASNLHTRKWGKRYPIMVSLKKPDVNNDCSNFFLYFETSWEKEAWCKTLRIASSADNKLLLWYQNLHQEFNQYVESLKAAYSLFVKPTLAVGEPPEKNNKVDDTYSKFRHWLKKVAKKTQKNDAEQRGYSTKIRSNEEKKLNDLSHSSERDISHSSKRDISHSSKRDISHSSKRDISHSSGRDISHSSERDISHSSGRDISHSSERDISHSSQSISSVVNFSSDSLDDYCSESNEDEKNVKDDGAFCLNLLVSRLFFDAKRNEEMVSSIQARIQRALSNMRTPSYVGKIACSSFNLGQLPPHIRKISAHPMNMKEICEIEIDIEYYGGATLDIETRLEACEPDFQKGIIDTSLGREITSDLLEEFEHMPLEINDSTDRSNEQDNQDFMKKSKSARQTAVSKWKSVLNSIADQVSQVPLSLRIKITLLRGTIRLSVKPPPSDQLWFGFTSMPEIKWDLESAVGDHRITNTQVALIIGSRIKAALRENLVLPNCECLSIPFMSAEKEDWVPRSSAPYIWLHQKAGGSTTFASSNSYHEKIDVKCDPAHSNNKDENSVHLEEDEHENLKNATCTQSISRNPTPEIPFLSQPDHQTVNTPQLMNHLSDDLRTPLLNNNKFPESLNKSTSVPTMKQDLFDNIEADNLRKSASLNVMDQSCYFTKIEGNSRSIYPKPPIPPWVIESKDEHLSLGEDGNPKKTGRRARMLDLGKKMGEKLEKKRHHLEEKSRSIVEKIRLQDS